MNIDSNKYGIYTRFDNLNKIIYSRYIRMHVHESPYGRVTLERFISFTFLELEV